MPTRKLNAEEQAFVDYWSQKAFYFIKMIRRADVYVRSISRERYLAAYKEFANSGQVIGGEWNNPNRNDRRSWHPKQEERDVYIKYLEDLIKNHPPTSPLNAAKILFAGNAGLRCISSLIVMERSELVQDRYSTEFHKLNDKDLKEVYGDQQTARHDIVSHPNEDPSDKPFVRSRQLPRNPRKMLSPNEWKQFEKVGETYFFKDEDDTTGFSAFQLAGIVILPTGTFYNIRFEETVDSSRIPEQELLGMIRDGIWF